jgi:hypothetical protein
MLYQVVFGHIGCITPINPTSKFGPIPCPMATRGKVTTFETQKTKIRIKIMDEG